MARLSYIFIMTLYTKYTKKKCKNYNKYKKEKIKKKSIEQSSSAAAKTYDKASVSGMCNHTGTHDRTTVNH